VTSPGQLRGLAIGSPGARLPSPVVPDRILAGAGSAVTASPGRVHAFDRWVVPELETLYRVALAVTILRNTNMSLPA